MLIRQAICFTLGFYCSVFICFIFIKSHKLYNDKVAVARTHKLRNHQVISSVSKESVFDEKISDELFKKVRIFCLIATYPANHKTRAIHIKNTWGKRCNKILFISTEHDRELGTVVLSMNETRNSLWGKTKRAFQYSYENHFKDYDFFMKADDDR